MSKRRFSERRATQEREVAENSNHPKMVWDMQKHCGWGNNICWMDFESRRISGHTTPLPCVGDELLCQMQSGKTARFRFVKVEPCVDPSDMWFGNVEDIGYDGETNKCSAPNQ
jgi:hypothetical protein